MENITVLIKPSSSDCNLNCSYCFYKDLSDNRDTESFGFMNLNTLESIIKNALDKDIFNCTFMFQGGEPTLIGLEFYKEAVNFQKKYNKNNVNITNAIQTNGINLNEDFIKFFKDNNFLVGVSLDGPKDIHDLNRIHYNGFGSFDEVMDTISLLKKYSVNYNILSVVTKESAKNINTIYDFYKNQGFEFIQFIPCIKKFDANSLDDTNDEPYYLDSKSYFDFLDVLFNLWYDDMVIGNYIEIRNFMDYISVIRGYNPPSCGMGGFCSIHTVIESNGDVYPCDFYCLDKWKLGSVNDSSLIDLRKNDVARKFFERSLYVHDDCKFCNYYKLCGGGCRRNQEPFVNGVPSLNYQCEGIKGFFDENLKKLVHLSEMV
ncbi:MAG: anaerobic sulfatase maturase [Peptostreptococcaceae bacterium]